MPASPVAAPAARRRLSEADAVDIWIARWLRIRRKDLIARYGCDPRRLYDIWEERRFPGSRDKALALFREHHPTLVERIDCGLHRRIPRRVPAELQPGLFDHLDAEEDCCAPHAAKRKAPAPARDAVPELSTRPMEGEG